MNKFIIVSLIIVLVLGFQIKDLKLKNIQTNNDALKLDACTSNQTQALYNAINTCQMPSETNTLNCIDDRLVSRIRQKWNLFTKRQNDLSGVAFWIQNNCSINLNRYGTYNRTYIAWPSQAYKSVNSNCSVVRNASIYTAIRGCEMFDETNTAKCIINALRIELNEYWNAYVATRSTLSAVNYWFYDDCSIIFSNYGQYNRTYNVWKAY